MRFALTTYIQHCIGDTSGPNILQCACVIMIIDNLLHTYNAIITLKNSYFVSANTISGLMVLFST